MHLKSSPKIFYRRRLPHYQPPNETFHVTFRLAGSLPVEIARRLRLNHQVMRQSLDRASKPEERKRLVRELGATYLDQYDRYLDRATEGPFWLSQDTVAAHVEETIRSQDGGLYDLLAYCVMPNHLHLLATFWGSVHGHLRADVERSLDRSGPGTVAAYSRGELTEVSYTTNHYVVTSALKKIKGITAYECNKLLHRRGQFWHHESYDHVIRNDLELERTVLYILQNPVKAGLCKEWRGWKWSYVKNEIIEQLDDV